MDEYTPKIKVKQNPKITANLLSSLTFLYTLPLFQQSIKKRFSEEHIYETLAEHKASILSKLAVEYWTKELENSKIIRGKPSLARVIFKLFLRQYLVLLIPLMVTELGAKIIAALLLGELIESQINQNGTYVYIYGTAIVVCLLAQLLISHQYHIKTEEVGLKMYISCCSLVYHKILKLNLSVLKQLTSGQIVNLLSNDTILFETFVHNTHRLCIIPFQIILILYFSYVEIGITTTFGVCFILLIVPIHCFSGRYLSKYRQKMLTKRDDRISTLNEIVQGISPIKMYTWEKPFASIISNCRKPEIQYIRISSYIKGLFSIYPVFVVTSIFLAIVGSILLGAEISTRNVFVLIALYVTVNFNVFVFVPQATASIQEGKVSIRRILNFLLSDELFDNHSQITTDFAVSVKNGTAKWYKSHEQYTISNFSCDIRIGSLVAIIGPVGSGKSSLFQLILKELPLITGELSINGTVSYASQDPWIFSSSIRSNILFGNEMDEIRYKKVVNCCSLDHDFTLLPSSDKTIVGERGVLLSGGQKARINLARAIYQNADIYLLDDPLSGVDTHVGKNIFQNCFRTFLKNKTIIINTHQLQYLKCVDRIIILSNGSLIDEGSLSELQENGYDFSQHLKKNENVYNVNSTNTKSSLRKENYLNQSKMMENKVQSTGINIFHIYENYLLPSKSYVLIVLAPLAVLLSQTCISFSYVCVTQWIKTEKEDADYNNQQKFRIYVYCSVIFLLIIFTVMRIVVFTNLCMKSSRVLHNNMLKKVLHASMQFFYSSSSGQILNRFTTDLGDIDENLPQALLETFGTIGNCVGIFVMVCIINPWFVVPTAALLILLYYTHRYYLKTNMDVYRVEGTTRSPIYSRLNTTLQGLATIRAFGVQEILTKEFNAFLDRRSSAYYLSLTLARTFSYWTDMFCLIYFAIIIFCSTFSTGSTAEQTGLAISQALQLIGLLQWTLKQATLTENYMISVEQLLEYNSIPQEQRFTCSEGQKPASTGPEHGRIVFKDVSLKYSECDPYVLKNISFVVESQEKIGIVGRTGSGKSSLITALFQLVETEGLITIDNVDIKKIGLGDLRKFFSILPQDPIIFSGTVRKNLDIFNEYTDEVLWKALEVVQLKEVILSTVGGLDAMMSQNGSSLSVGQRQLFCLARTLIRNNKIFILDEATANVDFETDKIIQETIRKSFSNYTVLTIAHRLNTIMDSDKIMVISAGKLIEFDHPYILLQNQESHFYRMIQETDESTISNFLNISEKNYHKRNIKGSASF